ncbi:hypothetical protein D9M69_588710 [compost metagenome]
MVTCRKPLPLTARSSWLPDCCRLPWANERLVATVRTPRPICRPVGRLFCSVAAAPTWRRFWYIRSSNTALARLNPLVDTLAMLLEITSSCVCWACMPVLEIQRELIMVCSWKGGISRSC